MITATQQLTDAEFAAFRELIYREAGISLSPAKRTLVASRLAKRLRHLEMDSYADYYEFVVKAGRKSDEYQQMINCITTNKTEFFREPHHFEFLRHRLIPQLASHAAKRTLRIWSAGCSTGEEPYTLAITVLETLGANHGWDIKILASDIDTEVLTRAQDGIYSVDGLVGIPESLKQKYFLRGAGPSSGMVRIHPELQRMIDFRRINLIEEGWPVRSTFDMIFCRNVLIYFDRPTQERLVQRFSDRLNPEGHLFLGHSENVAWLATHLAALGNTIYRLRPGVRPESKPAGFPAAAATPSLRIDLPKTPGPTHTTGGPIEVDRKIVIGDVFATDKPAVIHTLLGSCVSACIYDPQTGIGGMNHFMLPGGKKSDPARFGLPAMENLVDHVVRLGGDRSRLRAKLVGAAQLANLPIQKGDVWRKNAEFARKWLASSQIPVEAERIGGDHAMQVQFFPQSGRVRLKPVPSTACDHDHGEAAVT